MAVKLDHIDKQIVEILQENGRITNSELAGRVGLTTTPTMERVRRLEREGVIKGYAARIDREAAGKGMLVFCSIKLTVHQLGKMEEFTENISHIPEILACYNTTGEYDYLLKVVVKDTTEYEKFLRTKLVKIPGVERLHTSIVLSVLKEHSKIKVTDDENERDETNN